MTGSFAGMRFIVVLFGAMALTVARLHSAEVIIATNAVWKYLDNGSDQGTAWIATNFNDSTWPAGPAEFGYGDGFEATTNSFGPDSQNKFVTTYFRQAVIVPNPSVYTNLNLRVLRDDGAVVYINGSEVWRLSVTNNPVVFTNLASTQTEYGYESTNLLVSVLQPGTNFVAVEVHQGSLSSSDMSFALELTGDRSGANVAPSVSITSPTNNQSFTAPATINIVASASDTDGTVALVEFSQNGTKLGEDSTAPYSNSWANVFAGSYQLRAVTTDNLGATATSAIVNVTVTGNAAPTASITAPTNGSVFMSPTNVTITASASDPNGNLDRVEFYEGSTLLGSDSTNPYGITWTNPAISSYALRAVAIDTGPGPARGTSAPVSVSIASAAPTNLIVRGSMWKYWDEGTDPGAGWNQRIFDDSGWSNGLAELGYGDIPDGRPEATVIRFGPDQGNKYPAYFFRHTFPVADPNAYVTLTLGLMRDDGGIVYLNGQEVFRSNVRDGELTYLDFSGMPSVPNADESRFFYTNPPPGLLVAGANVVAVQIHQNTGGSSDISFDLELIGRTSNERPVVNITSPTHNTTYTAPATITIGASASDADGAVTLVEFFQNGVKLGEDSVAPYSFLWSDVSVGTYNLTAVATDSLGATTTSPVVTVFVTPAVPPTIASVNPPAGNVNSLSQITVTFTENVSGVTASDLLINGVPATSVAGLNAVYTFSFAQPRDGVVRIAWDASHGIADFESPPQRFDHYGAGANWQYNLADTVAPVISQRDPAAGATVSELTKVSVTFNEAVWGVDQTDLLINGAAVATSLQGSGAGPYTFEFAQPASGSVTFNWAGGHNIRDFATTPNLFAGGSWSYTLDPTANYEGRVVINEIMYHPVSQLETEEYIEIYNRGGSAVNLAGWSITRGVDFAFPSMTLPSGGYLVIAADPAAFSAKYPGVANVIGGWTGRLSNTREDVELEDATGARVDLVEYADEGDFAIRRRPQPELGWQWFAEHDGLGKSLELRNTALENNSGQNWTTSIDVEGTPGRANSTATNNVAPLILDVSHFPVIPRPTDSITISARIIDEQTTGLTVTLLYRDDSVGGAFASAAMFDDGAHNDGASGDGVYGANLSPMANLTIVEFYVEASDSGGRVRTWPALVDDGGTLAQEANAFFQVDNEVYAGNQSLYRLIMRASDKGDFFTIINRSNNPRRNTTFIAVEGANVEVRYNCDVRRRGASSFSQTPPTMKFTLPSDRPWNDKTSVNLNSYHTWAQVVGSAISLKAGLPAPRARGVQVRFNGINESDAGQEMYGSYAHAEVTNDEWARDLLPEDGDGNVYSKRRAGCPVDGGGFEYWGAMPQNYINCGYDKESNTSENDWTDLMNLLRAVDPDTTPDSDYVAAMRRNANIDLWLRYFAVLFLMNSTETALNAGADDDYNMYRGVVDPRFLILPHDLDQILGSEGTLPNDIFVAARIPNISRFLHHPEFEPLYYEEFRRQLAGVFSTNQLFPLFDQILGDWVPADTLQTMRDQTLAKINYVSSVLPPPPVVIQATITGEPAAVTYLRTATLTVGGTDITHYRFRTNNGAYSSERTVSTPISLSGLADGTYTVYVIGRNAAGTYQSQSAATVSKTWTVIGSLANVVINEVLALNQTVNYSNGFPDLIELYNPRASSVDLSGLRLTDDPNDPGQFTFPSGSNLAAGAYLILSANNLPFALNQDGDGLYLFDRASNGGALLDSVEFGRQLPDRSIGRLANGQWALTTPTFGAANVPHATGDIYSLRINEWLADGVFPFTDDFIEIYNPGSSPVDLGGLYLTDNPIGEPARHRIGPLHFVDAFAYTAFIADGDPEAGSDHVDFGLALERGEIGLFDPDLALIDCITYTQQYSGQSQGRSPNGSNRIVFLLTPTPGAGNPGPVNPDPPVTINLIPINDTFLWRYEESGTDLLTAWRASGYNDSGWPQGPPLLGRARNGCGGTCPSPIRTPLVTNTAKITFYFRARFNIASNVNLSSLEMRHTIDDGAVFYINGEEAGRFNMPGGTVTYGTTASQNITDATSQGPFTLPLTNVFAGTNVLAVEIHQAAGTSQDIIFGLELNGIIVTNNPAAAGVVINEVLANSQTLTNQFLGETNSSEADWIELYNPSNGAVDLSNMSLTDDVSLPRRWVFPPGSVIPALGYFQVRSDSSAPSSPTNTGFGLSQNGEAVYLFNKPANGGALLDSIAFGLQAADFSIGRFPNGSSNWVICLPTPRATNLRVTSLGDITRLRVNEWFATGDDWFEIYNPNAQPVDVSGIFLTDDPSTPASRTNKYQAPRLSFIGIGAFAYQRFEAIDNPDQPNEVDFRLSPSFDRIAIYRDAVTAVDIVTFSNQVAGVSEGRLPDGNSVISKFTNSASPGDANYVLLNNVVISEVLTHTPTNGPFEDAIELRNLTASPVTISGWYLSDSKNNLKKYRIRSSPATTIGANGFMVFYENQFNSVPGDPTSFSLNASSGDEVYLSQATPVGDLTGHRAVASFGPGEATVSFGRYQTSREVHFTALSRRTFGMDNPDDVGEFRQGTGLANATPLVGPVVISEFMYHPPDDNSLHEYVELRNITPSPVPLYHTNYTTNTWRLRRGVDYDFPPNITLPVGAVILVVSFDPFNDPGSLSSFRTRYSLSTAATTPGVTIFGPYSGRLDNAGEAIEIRKPDAPLLSPDPDAGMVPYIAVDRVDYTDRTPPWPFGADGAGDSLQRVNLDEYGNDPINWRADPPTPGPGASDTDADGLDDNWERTYFGNLAQGPGGDFDSDGMSNLNEFRAGTNPADGSSSLRLTIVSMSPVTLRFFSVASKTYTLEYQNSLSLGPWNTLSNLAAQGSSSFRQVTDPSAPGMRFYRIRTP